MRGYKYSFRSTGNTFILRVQRADWSCGCCELTNLSDDLDLLNLMTDQNIPKRRQRLIEDMLIKGL